MRQPRGGARLAFEATVGNQLPREDLDRYVALSRSSRAIQTEPNAPEPTRLESV